MINPTEMAWREMSEGIPNNEQAIGISNREPPATPEDPAAAAEPLCTSHLRGAVGDHGTQYHNL